MEQKFQCNFVHLILLKYLTKTSNQIQSFEAELSVPELASSEGGPETFRGVFIRAPAILEVGPEVKVLADYHAPSNGLLEVSLYFYV